jgi:hypothetical protein
MYGTFLLGNVIAIYRGAGRVNKRRNHFTEFNF